MVETMIEMMLIIEVVDKVEGVLLVIESFDKVVLCYLNCSIFFEFMVNRVHSNMSAIIKWIYCKSFPYSICNFFFMIYPNEVRIKASSKLINPLVVKNSYYDNFLSNVLKISSLLDLLIIYVESYLQR